MAAIINQYVNDYRYIWTTVAKESDNSRTIRRRITVDDTNQWHAKQHHWLQQEIQKARENREHVVIITYHAPCRRNICSLEDEESQN